MDEDGFYMAYHMTTKRSGVIPSNFIELHQLPPVMKPSTITSSLSLPIRNEQEKKISKNDKEKESKEKKVSTLSKLFSKKWFFDFFPFGLCLALL